MDTSPCDCNIADDERTECPASDVAGHLKDGHSHVTSDAERDAESDAAEQCHLEPSAAVARTSTAAAVTLVADPVDRAWTRKRVARLLVLLVQVVIVDKRLLITHLPRHTVQAQEANK